MYQRRYESSRVFVNGSRSYCTVCILQVTKDIVISHIGHRNNSRDNPSHLSLVLRFHFILVPESVFARDISITIFAWITWSPRLSWFPRSTWSSRFTRISLVSFSLELCFLAILIPVSVIFNCPLSTIFSGITIFNGKALTVAQCYFHTTGNVLNFCDHRSPFDQLVDFRNSVGIFGYLLL